LNNHFDATDFGWTNYDEYEAHIDHLMTMINRVFKQTPSLVNSLVERLDNTEPTKDNVLELMEELKCEYC
jgi:hypothetical protein